MKIKIALKCLVLLTVIFCSLSLGHRTSAGAVAQDPLTPEERRGKQIYLQGTSASGEPIVASLGEAGLEVPASAMPCASCHGVYGKGKPEGAIRPSNLTWESLTTANSPASLAKRIHPPYTERTLEVAITQGKDPAGNKIGNAMPRFQIPAEDLADLIAYLKRLGHDRDPGISDNKIVIGSILPARSSLATMGQSIKAVLTAFFAELNSQGGLYNRSFELKFVETADTAAATRNSVERFLKDEQIFALTGAFIAGSEKEIAALMEQQEVPSIGPLTLYPQTGAPLNRQVFYLLSGIDTQARGLIDFASKQAGPRKLSIAVVYPRNELNAGVVEAIKDQCKRDSLSVPQTYDYVLGRFDAAETSKRLQQAGRDVVFFLGSSEEALSLMREAEKLGWFPSIYGPAAIGGSGIFDAPAGFDHKIFFSFPTSPADQTVEGAKEFRALQEKYKLPTQNVAAQISTYSAVRILVEGLKLAGKDLSREQLVRALEGLNQYKTGLTPAITYGPNRRIGALGTYVVTIDLKEKKFGPVSGWITPN